MNLVNNNRLPTTELKEEKNINLSIEIFVHVGYSVHCDTW